MKICVNRTNRKFSQNKHIIFSKQFLSSSLYLQYHYQGLIIANHTYTVGYIRCVSNKRWNWKHHKTFSSKIGNVNGVEVFLECHLWLLQSSQLYTAGWSRIKPLWVNGQCIAILDFATYICTLASLSHRADRMQIFVSSERKGMKILVGAIPNQRFCVGEHAWYIQNQFSRFSID